MEYLRPDNIPGINDNDPGIAGHFSERTKSGDEGKRDTAGFEMSVIKTSSILLQELSALALKGELHRRHTKLIIFPESLDKNLI